MLCLFAHCPSFRRTSRQFVLTSLYHLLIPSSVAVFQVARMSFVNKLISCGYGRQYIDMLLLHCNYVIPHNSSLRRPFTSTKPHVMWLVMPYHPVWERSGLKRVVAQFCDDPLFKDLLFEAFGSVSIPQIKVAWKISSVPFGGTLVKW